MTRNGCTGGNGCDSESMREWTRENWGGKSGRSGGPNRLWCITDASGWRIRPMHHTCITALLHHSIPCNNRKMLHQYDSMACVNRCATNGSSSFNVSNGRKNSNRRKIVRKEQQRGRRRRKSSLSRVTTIILHRSRPTVFARRHSLNNDHKKRTGKGKEKEKTDWTVLYITNQVDQ